MPNEAEFVAQWRDYDDEAVRVCSLHLPKAIQDLYEQFGHSFSVEVQNLNPGSGFKCEMETDETQFEATMILEFYYDGGEGWPFGRWGYLALYAARALTDIIPDEVKQVAMELNVKDMRVRYYGPYRLLVKIDQEFNRGSGTPDVTTILTPTLL